MLISTNSGLYSARPGKVRFAMADAMDFFGKMGFEAVDVNFAATIYPEEEKHEPILDGDWKKNLDEVLAAIRRNHLVISHTHLPFYDYAMEDQENLAFRNKMLYLALDATAYIDAGYAVIHPLRFADGHTDVEKSIAYMTPYAQYAEKLGVTLCVENMAKTVAEELNQIADALHCGVCWDVGHCNFGHYDQYENMMKLGSRLKVLHLHDNYGTKDDHSLPFLGTVEWDKVMKALNDLHYEGTFNYEVAASKLPECMREAHARYMIEAARHLLGR